MIINPYLYKISYCAIYGERHYKFGYGFGLTLERNVIAHNMEEAMRKVKEYVLKEGSDVYKEVVFNAINILGSIDIK